MLPLQLIGLGLANLTLLCLLSHKSRKIRGLSGCLLSLFSVATFVVFLRAYAVSGGPDAGKEWMQIFFPGLVFLALFTAGVIGVVSAFQAKNKLS